jgi:hypothetical protein
VSLPPCPTWIVTTDDSPYTLYPNLLTSTSFSRCPNLHHSAFLSLGFILSALSIHDELIFEVNDSWLRSTVDIMKQVMLKHVPQSMGIHDVDLEVKVMVGKTWGDMSAYAASDPREALPEATENGAIDDIDVFIANMDTSKSALSGVGSAHSGGGGALKTSDKFFDSDEETF